MSILSLRTQRTCEPDPGLGQVTTQVWVHKRGSVKRSRNKVSLKRPTQEEGKRRTREREKLDSPSSRLPDTVDLEIRGGTPVILMFLPFLSGLTRPETVVRGVTNRRPTSTKPLLRCPVHPSYSYSSVFFSSRRVFSNSGVKSSMEVGVTR